MNPWRLFDEACAAYRRLASCPGPSAPSAHPGRSRLVRVIAPLRTAKIHGRIPAVRIVGPGVLVARPTTLLTRPCVEQRAVDREMLRRQQPLRAGGGDHLLKEGASAMSPASSRSRFFVNLVASHTTSLSDKPTN